MFDVFKVLQRRSRSFYFFITVLGIVNAGCQLGIIYLINKTISFQPLPFFPEYNWLVYLSILALALVTTLFFQRYLIRLTNELAYEFNIGIFEKMRNASFQQLEKVSRERVYAAMEDVDHISSFPVQFLNILNSFIIVVCGIAFMFTLSLAGTLMLLGAMVLLTVIYIYRNKRVERNMNKVRDLENDFFRYLHDLLSGFREVLMSTRRNNNLHEKFISENRRRSKDLKISTAIYYMGNDLTGTYSWYLIIGLLLFGFSRISEIGVAGAVSFTFIMFYIMGPLSGLIRYLPLLTQARIAYARIMQFLSELDTPAAVKGPGKELDAAFQSLQLRDVCYAYSGDQEAFRVGPLNIDIQRGELIFITGGNGSGKSTFAHLLTGIFQPSSGEILYNGVAADTSAGSYRDRVSVVFTDPYLFSHNYEDYRYADLRGPLENYAAQLELQDVLKIDYEADRISKDLSKGQQKRLALIYALLENRPLLIMDEWAAEQDPEFRRYFYTVLLPELKATGKTVLLITHDDRYFHCADRILKFEHGNTINQNYTVPEYGASI